MSDVTVAPAATPAASTPASTASSASTAPTAAPRQEVPVNPNPVAAPPPIGPQAPPADEKPRPADRREGIQRAINKHRAEHPVEARVAKKGDNNPPEDTPDEPLDLKKRPSDQPRDRGRFAAKPAPDTTHPPGVAAGQPAARPGTQAAPQPYQPPPGAPVHHHPIPRMSDRAKADWDKVPDTVRMDAHRIAREVDTALRQYKGAHDYMQTLAPYEKMAREQGTHLAKVLENHVGIEAKLREDPIGGLEVIVHNLNLHTPEGQKITLRDVAWHVLNQTPEQQQLVQGRNEATAMRLQIEQMRREQQALANEYRRMQYAAHFHTTRGAVDQYADQRPRFDELGDLIHREIQLGFSLDEAYRRADLLRPATAAQTRTDQPTAAQTRTPDRSISGSPAAGQANGARGSKPVSRMDAIKHAVNHHRSSIAS